MSGSLFLQAIIAGVLQGGVYALVAMALALVFGVMRILNFAHGDLLMVGMYGIVLLSQSLGIGALAAGAVILPFMCLLGFILFITVFRPILKSTPLMQAQLTIGLSFVIQSIALIAFGADLLNVPSAMSTATAKIFGQIIPLALLIGFAVSIGVSAVLSWFLLRTETGYLIRATAQDATMARLCGINVPRVQMWVFATSIGLLAIPAGCLMMFFHVTPMVGIQFSLLSLLIVVLGGLGDLRGAFVGGILIGVIESLSSAFLNSAAAPALIYVVFGLTLLVRPRGLFGQGANA